jgi:hypothetical protein
MLSTAGYMVLLNRISSSTDLVLIPFSLQAPEIFKKSGHGKPVDVWAIGVVRSSFAIPTAIGLTADVPRSRTSSCVDTLPSTERDKSRRFKLSALQTTSLSP